MDRPKLDRYIGGITVPEDVSLGSAARAKTFLRWLRFLFSEESRAGKPLSEKMLRAIVADAAMYARVPETPALCAWATGLLRSGDIVEYVPATAADVAAMRRRCGPSVEQQLDAVMAEYAPGYTLDDLIAATDGRTI